jgi:hypothetical protein
LEKKYGPCQHPNGEYEADEMVNEFAVFLMSAVLADVDARRKVDPRRRRGRPRDAITPDLAPNLLGYFLRNNNLSGRHSVIVTVDSKKKQEEAGPLLEFFKKAIEPLNQYLVELGRKPLSPARLARYALQVHRRQLALQSTANNPAGAEGGQRASTP